MPAGIGAPAGARPLNAAGAHSFDATTMMISPSTISPTMAPSDAFFMKPARNSAKSTSSIMTTNRNSTATAPT